MRLNKKLIATTILAVSIALTLAACGEGETGTPSEPIERPASSSNANCTANSKPDKPEQPNSKPVESSPASSEVSKPEMIVIDASNSKLVNYMKRLHNQDEVYERHIEISYNSLGEKISEYTINAARKGKNEYVRIWDGTKVVYSYYTEIEESTRSTYTLYEEGSVALKSTFENTTSNSSDGYVPNKIYATVKNINGREYYTEIYNDPVGDKHTVCFDESGIPVYMIDECWNPHGNEHTGHKSTVITEFQTMQFNSNGLCRVPENCTVYTIKSANLGVFLVDENGNEYYYSQKTGKVTDSEKNDVTEQFRWFINKMAHPIPYSGSISVWTG